MTDELRPGRVRLDVAYDGTEFSGFAPNVGVRTVGGELQDALSRVLGTSVVITVAGRTDKGVHAAGQVVTFDIPESIPGTQLNLTRLARALNSLCGPDIAVTQARPVGTDFDARFSARWRRYHYTVWNRTAPNPRLARWAWHVADPLELDAMNQAAIPLVGEHDFAAFCRRPPSTPGLDPPSLVRRVISATWEDLGDGQLRFDIAASSFCHQMVRSITALLVDVGRGRRHAADVVATLRSLDRAQSAGVAPPHGLSLVAVGYPD